MSIPSLSLIQVLMHAPLLAGITEAEAISLFAASEKLRLKRNVRLVESGQAEHAFYLILSGQVKVVLEGDKGKSVTLATLGAGECIGEMGALDQQAASATVIANSVVDVLRLHRETFVEVLHQNPQISISILQTLSRRLRHADAQIESLASVSVRGRVCRALMDMATRLPSGEFGVKGKFTHSELADKVGASREWVGKALKDLEMKGLIKRTRGAGFRIPDPSALPRD